VRVPRITVAAPDFQEAARLIRNGSTNSGFPCERRYCQQPAAGDPESRAHERKGLDMNRIQIAIGWANEFRPIIGVEFGRFGLTFNPIFGFALTGPEAFKPDFEPALKARWNTNLGFALGLEHYAALGRFDQGFVALRNQEHLTFLAFDLEPASGKPPSPWELNVGVGRALTDATAQTWLLKAIVGRSF